LQLCGRERIRGPNNCCCQSEEVANFKSSSSLTFRSRFAIASGLKPEAGLFTAIVAGSAVFQGGPSAYAENIRALRPKVRA
jgi:hypothetical protein